VIIHWPFWSSEEAFELLADPNVTHIHLPFNLLDARWKTDEFAAAVAVRRSRSAVFPGLMISHVPFDLS